MADTIGTAYIQIEPTTKGIGGKISSVLDGESEKAGKSAGSKLSGALGSTLKFGGVVLASITTAFAGATASIISNANATAEYGDNIDKTSQKLGLSASSFQKWDYVMNLAGTSMNNMGTGLKTLTNKLDEAKGGSESAQKMFETLGLSMDDLSTMSREDVFGAVITGFQGMADSTERAALANDLFGKSGQELTPLFNTTSEETMQLMQNLEDMGAVMSDDAVKAAADFEDSLTTMKASFGGLKNQLMGDFLPSISTVMDGLGKLASGDKSGLGQIKQGIHDLLSQMKAMMPDLIEIGGELIDSLVETIIENLPEIVEQGVEIILKLVVGILKALPKLVAKVPDIIKAIVSGLKGAWPELSAAGGDIVEGIWNGIENACGRLKDNVRRLAGELVESVKNFFKIGSPSKLFRDQVGQWIPAGIAVGIEGNTSVLDDSMKTMQSALDPAQLDVSRTYATNYDASSNDNGILALLEQYLPQLLNMQLVMDTGATVGALAPLMDRELGRMASMRSRYV